MKKFVRILCLTLVAVMLCATLASCGGVPSGKYTNGDTAVTKSYTQYEFSGSKFVFTTYLLGNKVDATSYEGKYKVDGEEITFTWEDSEGKEQSNTVAFAKNDDGSLKIGVLTYTLVED